MFYEIDYKKIFPRNGGGVFDVASTGFRVQAAEKALCQRRGLGTTELYFGTSKAEER